MRRAAKAWTRAEVEHLKELRELGFSYHQCAEDMGRSTKQIEKKCTRLGFGGIRSLTQGRPRKAPALSPALTRRLGITSRNTKGGAGTKEPTVTTRGAKGSDKDHRALEPVLIIPDAHVPFHHRAAWDLLLQVGRDLKPKLLVAIGDLADFYAVSQHDKSPERAHQFDQELEAVDECLDQLDALGATDKLYIEGNHEDRLKRYLMKNPALHGVVTTPKLLRLKERGWEFVPYKEHAARGAVHFTHDVGVSSRYAVYRALELYQHSVVTGHTHRMAYIVEGSAVGDTKLSASFGWLGDVEQVEYMTKAKARRDWCLGFGIGYFDPSSGYCYLVPVPIIHNSCCVSGTLYRARAAAA